jgi:hypothetical protein
MLKMTIAYVHLLATCMALGSIFIADWRLLRGREFALRPGALARLATTQRLVNVSLAALWLTGAALIWIGYAQNPDTYLGNQKLWAKISVVAVLTLNGVFLHRFAFPSLQRGYSLSTLSNLRCTLHAILGGISVASWLFAAWLGMARPWNNTVAYGDVMALYFALLGLAILGTRTMLGGGIFCKARVDAQRVQPAEK